jgi:Gp157 protein
MLASVVRSHLDDLAILAALRTRLLDMQERFAGIEYRADKKRALVASVMERAGIKKLTEPDFTASLREVPPGLVVIEEGKIPDAFWKPQPPKLDRKGLLAALKAGEVVAGAALGNGSTTLTVRTR